MRGAITILILAWIISTVVSEMHTGEYLSTLVAGNIHAGFLPVILFMLAGVMAFATGTSWGTFGIMLPIAAAMAVKVEPSLIIPCMSAVMAGAVFGDHCSPISDTTILSSTGAHCNHIDHRYLAIPLRADRSRVCRHRLPRTGHDRLCTFRFCGNRHRNGCVDFDLKRQEKKQLPNSKQIFRRPEIFLDSQAV